MLLSPQNLSYKTTSFSPQWRLICIGFDMSSLAAWFNFNLSGEGFIQNELHSMKS